MKEPITCSLTGHQWWKPFLGFLVLSVVIMVPLQTASNSMSEITDLRILLSSFSFILVLSVLLTLVQAAFTITLSRIALPLIAFRGKQFSFNGSAGEYVSLHLVCILLSLITFGFYLPWYYTRTMQYYVSHISYDGEAAKFEGRPGKLMKYYVLGLILPLLVLFIVFGVLLSTAIMYQTNNYPENAEKLFFLVGVVYIVFFILIIPFMYNLYKWFINISWKNLRFYWKTEFWGSFFFLVGQLLLSLVTLGIYLPAAILAIYKYFIDRTVIDRDGQPAGRFEFARERGGFAFLWGQILLSIVTVGIYLPWAYANILRYVLSHVTVDETPAELPQNY